MGEVFLRLQPTAGQQGVGGADNGGVAERRAHVEIIILTEKRTVNDAEDVVLIVLPVFIHKLGGDLLHLLGKVALDGNIKTAL